MITLYPRHGGEVNIIILESHNKEEFLDSCAFDYSGSTFNLERGIKEDEEGGVIMNDTGYWKDQEGVLIV